MNDAAALQKENELLKQQLCEKENILSENKKTLLEKEKIISESNDQLAQKNHYIFRLEELIKQFQRKQFSASSEKIPANQLGMFNEAEEQQREEAAEEGGSIPVKGHERKKKSHLAFVFRITFPARTWFTTLRKHKKPVHTMVRH